MPDRWDCVRENTEWVCKSTVVANTKEAIIILTAKEIGPEDSLAAYESHLKTPRMVPDAQGRPQKSVIKSVVSRKIAQHTWLDGLQLGSEIPSYYTRYLATVKSRLAILVTFSAHQRYFTKYSGDFFKAVNSLRIVANSDLLNPSATSSLELGGSEQIGPGQVPGFGSPLQVPDLDTLPSEPSGAPRNQQLLFLIGIIIAVAGIFIFLKRK
ncbi:MAG: hypothetical protein COT74_02630 [Bdellovibrionales bacterium CG10_big_fil_rev_8_21_14_0_10_45_34]|nr:MAG: hypothetical protein COT74_02630 [Bdellovibrionales bacterium CG10_big_fil_rev_8_21_14_0_10_45_34]